MNGHTHSQWEDLVGTLVEIRRDRTVVRIGIVEEAMPDGSAIWIASHENQQRRIYEKSQGFLVYVEPQPLSGTSRYRMTTARLYPPTRA